MSSTSRRLIDLSHVVEDGMITYPGLPVPTNDTSEGDYGSH